ncbi:MAG: RluA family pseudouridine synthase [Flavobacteriales bacterium]|jgi:23S rRNA pseudouridine1911/1915/1917 synthase|nr:RluA family pseudouridine synthase [Flavobacteriales bacterium]NCG29017.1 RluA family pseudouridine synthase [Bacteroidota bacterium]MBT3963452.1 RluA family pseudouridine synthase [Flavobacteriales bacterium]MBT4704437.1 RluA family pseudouridine synthase [Flavobacteriales bacterium]MBT4931192.1 RluA family pseudouridine synthase [Flavobacteriales bacterium]
MINTEGVDIDQDDEELFEHHKVIADPGQTALRVDKFLIDRIPNVSRSKISLAAKSGNLHVNGAPVKANYKVKALDEVALVFAHPRKELELIAEDIPLDIIYEDDDVIVVNKAAEMVVHPGHGNYSGTLINALLHHINALPDKKSDPNGYPGLVHRIDKGTTGLLVVAKTEQALNHLGAQFFKRTSSRLYDAIVWGDVEEEEGTVIGNIGRSKSDRKQMAVFPPDGELGKHAVTNYKVIERLGYVTLVQCKLDTGRTHQIRAHMKHIGHTLFGDPRYGGDRVLKGTTFSKYRQFIDNCFKTLPRQALHARTLGFTHPSTEKWMEFEAPLPEDMLAVLEKWRGYTKANN